MIKSLCRSYSIPKTTPRAQSKPAETLNTELDNFTTRLSLFSNPEIEIKNFIPKLPPEITSISIRLAKSQKNILPNGHRALNLHIEANNKDKSDTWLKKGSLANLRDYLRNEKSIPILIEKIQSMVENLI